MDYDDDYTDYEDDMFVPGGGGGYSEEDADGDDESLKYFNYAALSPVDRQRRIAYAVRCLLPIVEALQLAVVATHNVIW